MKSIRYTIRSKDAQSMAELAGWVSIKESRHLTTNDCLMIARGLLSGQCWAPEYYRLNDPEAEGPCEFEVIEPVNENLTWINKQLELNALLKLGAAGDVEAAIAYCKADLAGKIKRVDESDD